MEDERKSHDAEFVEYVIKSIVDHPDDVKIDREIDEMGVLITLTVNPEDMGQVIGRQGATAKSVRTLLRVIGARNNARVNLKINEPEGGSKPADAAPVAEQASDESGDEGTSEQEETKPSVEDAIDDLDL